MKRFKIKIKGDPASPGRIIVKRNIGTKRHASKRAYKRSRDKKGYEFKAR